MKKILLLTSLLLFTVVALLGVGFTSEELAWGWGATGLGIFVFICIGFLSIIGILLFVLWIITIIDCAKRKNEDFPGEVENSKTIWLVILIATWVVGFWWVAAVVYYFVVMKKIPQKK
jgi:hypothetical protein